FSLSDCTPLTTAPVTGITGLEYCNTMSYYNAYKAPPSGISEVVILTPSQLGCDAETNHEAEYVVTPALPISGATPSILCASPDQATTFSAAGLFIAADGDIGTFMLDAEVVGHALPAGCDFHNLTMGDVSHVVEVCSTLDITVANTSSVALLGNASYVQPDMAWSSATLPDCNSASADPLQVTLYEQPTITSTAPLVICQDEQVTLSGVNFISYNESGTPQATSFGGLNVVSQTGCQPITMAASTGITSLELCTTAVIDVALASITVDALVPIVASNPQCDSPAINMVAVSPIALARAAPSALCIASSANITIAGQFVAFDEAIASQFVETEITVDGAVQTPIFQNCTLLTFDQQGRTYSVDICNEAVLTFGATGGSTIETPEVNATHASLPCAASRAGDLFHFVPPPTVTNIAPDTICQSSRNTNFTLTGTFYIVNGQPLDLSFDDPPVLVGSSALISSNCSGNPTQVGALDEYELCTEFTVAVTDYTFVSFGQNVPVSVLSAGGCQDNSTINVRPAPIITGYEPTYICNDENVHLRTITLVGDNFFRVEPSPYVDTDYSQVTLTSESRLS
ncbi:MAG TPA: hypothetical protein V6D20_15965, partial [Candidatus Obscuribacterales bacterium]